MQQVPRYASRFIRKANHKHETLLRHDFAIDELAPHVLTVRRSKMVVEDAAGPEIDLGRDDLENPSVPTNA
jgi:hypothetical protein